MMTTISTADAAKIFLGIVGGISTPTVNSFPATYEQPIQRSLRGLTYNTSPSFSSETTQPQEITTQIDGFGLNSSTRSTTEHEKIIGEIRSWILLPDNWDGEGAYIPSGKSIKDAVAFIHLIKDSDNLPQPMLLATGHISLYWNESGLYADIEFLGEGRIAYFIKTINEDKHKGVLSFNSKEIPAVLSALLSV